MALGSFIFGIVMGAVVFSTFDTLEPLAKRFSEITFVVVGYLGKTLTYVGGLLD